MPDNKKEVKVKIVVDKSFRSTCWSWSPTQEELQQIVVGALKFFKEQFPTVSFSLRLKEEVWDSQSYPTMLDFLPSLMRGISNTRSFEVMKKILIQGAKDAGFRKENMIFNEGVWECIRIRNKNKSKKSQLHFLWGYLDRLFSEEILLDLKKKISHGDRERKIILGFTGRFFVVANPLGQCFAMAERGGSYAVFLVPTKDKLPHVILHEVGHLFGAQHIKKKAFLLCGENYLFDPVNVKRVNDHINKL